MTHMGRASANPTMYTSFAGGGGGARDVRASEKGRKGFLFPYSFGSLRISWLFLHQKEISVPPVAGVRSVWEHEVCLLRLRGQTSSDPTPAADWPLSLKSLFCEMRTIGFAAKKCCELGPT